MSTRRAPRVAYFPDSFHEVNGVAHTSRQFEAFARRRNLPFLCVRAGDDGLREEGNCWSLDLPRGMFSFALESDLRIDLAFPRHVPRIEKALARFRPDLIHVTGPSDLGVVGAGLALALGLPLAASWHTNVHEYAARRADALLRQVAPGQAHGAAEIIEQASLQFAAWLYAFADVLFAPNPELCSLLEGATGKPCFRMPRGVDTDMFHPARRRRSAHDGERVLGYVGRLSVEKNVALLAQLEAQLFAMGMENFRFVIVGEGAEKAMLRSQMRRAEFTGVLRGEALAQAYADMDLFVFPSHTDTFGNVVLEALASGVPAIVTPDGGPASIVRHDETGLVARDHRFAASIAGLLRDAPHLEAMGRAARAYAERASWDAVFEGVIAAYDRVAGMRV